MSDIHEEFEKIGELENQSVFLDKSGNKIIPKLKNRRPDWLIRIDKVKGIGKETIKDIEETYSSLAGFLFDLSNNKLLLRNDVILSLKKEFLKGGDN